VDDALADVRAAPTVDAFPALPYPGARPGYGYVQVDGRVLRLRRRSDSRWVLTRSGVVLDDWLARLGCPPRDSRPPLLCYGSNACPSKLQDLRDRRGLPGPVVMTPCTVTGLAAAWCAGERGVDRSIPATLVAAPGAEAHFLWEVAPEQWPALDRCEGRGQRYDLVHLAPGSVRNDLGEEVPGVRAYVGAARHRRPMVDARGTPLLVREVDQDGARRAYERLRTPWAQGAGSATLPG
jgi:hypothetical protein